MLNICKWKHNNFSKVTIFGSYYFIRCSARLERFFSVGCLSEIRNMVNEAITSKSKFFVENNPCKK